jgi:hypothetical protein
LLYKKEGENLKPWAEKFYKSKAWRDCREAFLQSKFFICERCEGAASIVHHKEYLTPENIDNPEITLNWNKLEALCQDCHNKEHHGSGEGIVREGLMFDEYGNLVEEPQ